MPDRLRADTSDYGRGGATVKFWNLLKRDRADCIADLGLIADRYSSARKRMKIFPKWDEDPLPVWALSQPVLDYLGEMATWQYKWFRVSTFGEMMKVAELVIIHGFEHAMEWVRNVDSPVVESDDLLRLYPEVPSFKWRITEGVTRSEARREFLDQQEEWFRKHAAAIEDLYRVPTTRKSLVVWPDLPDPTNTLPEHWDSDDPDCFEKWLEDVRTDPVGRPVLEPFPNSAFTDLLNRVARRSPGREPPWAVSESTVSRRTNGLAAFIGFECVHIKGADPVPNYHPSKRPPPSILPF